MLGYTGSTPQKYTPRKHTPWEAHPPGKHTPPPQKHTPRKHTHPRSTPPGTPLPGSTPRTVRILLECFLVMLKCLMKQTLTLWEDNLFCEDNQHPEWSKCLTCINIFCCTVLHFVQIFTYQYWSRTEYTRPSTFDGL